MNSDDQRTELLLLGGWTNLSRSGRRGTDGPVLALRGDSPEGKTNIIAPNPLMNEGAMRSLERKLGLDDRTSLDLRVKWVNALRDIVARRIPKNRSGTSLVSDIDLMFATLGERAEALLKAHKKWKP
jgi:hypothetical protein